MIWYKDDKDDLIIKHKFISIGGHENYDKGNNTSVMVLLWVFGSSCGLTE